MWFDPRSVLLTGQASTSPAPFFRMASSAALLTMLIENVSNQADHSRAIGVARRCVSSRMCFSTAGGRVLLDVVCFARFSCIRIVRIWNHSLVLPFFRMVLDQVDPAIMGYSMVADCS